MLGQHQVNLVEGELRPARTQNPEHQPKLTVSQFVSQCTTVYAEDV